MQFSLKALFLLVLSVAVGLTLIVLRWHWLSGALYTIYGLLIFGCILGSVGWRRERQAFCLGGTLIGIAYWLLVFVLSQQDLDDSNINLQGHPVSTVWSGRANGDGESLDLARPALLLSSQIIDSIQHLRRSPPQVGDRIRLANFADAEVIAINRLPWAVVQSEPSGVVVKLPVSQLRIYEAGGLKSGDTAHHAASNRKGEIIDVITFTQPLYVIQWADGSPPSELTADNIADFESREKAHRLTVGQEVSAMWPTTTDFYPGKITGLSSRSVRGYRIKFEDGKVEQIHWTDLLPTGDYVPIAGDKVYITPGNPSGSSYAKVLRCVQEYPSYQVRGDNNMSPDYVTAEDIFASHPPGRVKGHSVFGIGLTLLGGWIAAGMYRSTQREKTNTVVS